MWSGKPKEVKSGVNCCSTRPVLWHGLKVSQGRMSEMRVRIDRDVYFLLTPPRFVAINEEDAFFGRSLITFSTTSQ